MNSRSRCVIFLYCITILSGCQMQTIPNITELLITRGPVYEEEVQVLQAVYIEQEYVYTIIGAWKREFDGHVEEYLFTADELITSVNGSENGRYDISYDADWTFILLDTVFDYELLHSTELDVLILNGYQYRREA